MSAAVLHAFVSLARPVGGLILLAAGWHCLVRGVVRLQASTAPNRRGALLVLGGALACMAGIGAVATSVCLAAVEGQMARRMNDQVHVISSHSDLRIGVMKLV